VHAIGFDEAREWGITGDERCNAKGLYLLDGGCEFRREDQQLRIGFDNDRGDRRDFGSGSDQAGQQRTVT
jgi:hypothetical protein